MDCPSPSIWFQIIVPFHPRAHLAVVVCLSSLSCLFLSWSLPLPPPLWAGLFCWLCSLYCFSLPALESSRCPWPYTPSYLQQNHPLKHKKERQYCTYSPFCTSRFKCKCVYMAFKLRDAVLEEKVLTGGKRTGLVSRGIILSALRWYAYIDMFHNETRYFYTY